MRLRLIGFTIFILFFGVAVVDAIATHSWFRSIFWLALGVAFLMIDNRRNFQTK
jgi:hypothetical protein